MMVFNRNSQVFTSKFGPSVMSPTPRSSSEGLFLRKKMELVKVYLSSTNASNWMRYSGSDYKYVYYKVVGNFECSLHGLSLNRSITLDVSTRVLVRRTK